MAKKDSLLHLNQCMIRTIDFGGSGLMPSTRDDIGRILNWSSITIQARQDVKDSMNLDKMLNDSFN